MSGWVWGVGQVGWDRIPTLNKNSFATNLKILMLHFGPPCKKCICILSTMRYNMMIDMSDESTCGNSFGLVVNAICCCHCLYLYLKVNGVSQYTLWKPPSRNQRKPHLSLCRAQSLYITSLQMNSLKCKMWRKYFALKTFDFLLLR